MFLRNLASQELDIQNLIYFVSVSFLFISDMCFYPKTNREFDPESNVEAAKVGRKYKLKYSEMSWLDLTLKFNFGLGYLRLVQTCCSMGLEKEHLCCTHGMLSRFEGLHWQTEQQTFKQIYGFINNSDILFLDTNLYMCLSSPEESNMIQCISDHMLFWLHIIECICFVVFSQQTITYKCYSVYLIWHFQHGK